MQVSQQMGEDYNLLVQPSAVKTTSFGRARQGILLLGSTSHYMEVSLRISSRAFHLTTKHHAGHSEGLEAVGISNKNITYTWSFQTPN